LAGFSEAQILQSTGVSFINWNLPMPLLFIYFLCVWCCTAENNRLTCVLKPVYWY